MIDWSSSMQQTFEYYVVDPNTWKDIKRIDTILSSSISRDTSSETCGSANFKTTENLGECYIRVYLIVIQNGEKSKIPLGTYIAQTPSTSFDGKMFNISIDAYSPLIELKEKLPPLGYSLAKDSLIMENAYRLIRENTRAPVSELADSATLYSNFVADIDETWLSYISSLISKADKYFELDEMGRILFKPKQNTASLQPVWTYNSGNSSILYSDFTVDRDLYGIPNVVEVIYSNSNDIFYSRVVNDNPNSPVSTVSRGREIVQRIQNPTFPGVPTQFMVDEYAKQALESVSTLQCTISYKHGYCPVRTGDCVRFDYPEAELKSVKARVINQTIDCTPGCPVTETAVFTTKMWGD